jgi:hypothetical protein
MVLVRHGLGRSLRTLYSLQLAVSLLSPAFIQGSRTAVALQSQCFVDT